MSGGPRLGRRALLRGLGGVAVGLPLLDALRPRRAGASAQDARYVFFFRTGNGVAQKLGQEPETFWPDLPSGALDAAALGAASGRTLSRLAPFASKLSLVRGLTWLTGNFHHEWGCATALTACQTDPPGFNPDHFVRPYPLGESLDVRVARDVGQTEPLNIALCGWSYSPSMEAWISYNAPEQPVRARPALWSPWTLYANLFLSASPPEVVAELTGRRRKSVNDYVKGQLDELRQSPRLSSADRLRLDQHFSAIRDAERALSCRVPDELLQQIKAYAGDENELLPLRAELGKLWVPYAEAFLDLAALAVLCGASPALTFSFGGHGEFELFSCTRPDTGETVLVQFHAASHRKSDFDEKTAPGSEPLAQEYHRQIDVVHAGLFARLLGRLDQAPAPDGGSMLDAGLVVWFSEMSVGNHATVPGIPLVLAGSAGGRLVTGRYLDADPKTSHGKFVNTVGAAVGVVSADGAPLHDFGQAGDVGRFDELVAG